MKSIHDLDWAAVSLTRLGFFFTAGSVSLAELV
jgi:hypothetical protein